VTADKKQEIKSVPATSAKMVKTLENKTDAESMISDSGTLLQQAEKNLKDPQLASSTKLPAFNKVLAKVAETFNKPNPLEYSIIKENYDALKFLSEDSSSDIKWFDENRAKILTTIQDVDDNLQQTGVDITDFIKKADVRVVDSIDLLKNTQLQYIADDLAAGAISQKEATAETNKINKQYDAQYYTNYRQVIDKELNNYSQNAYISVLDPIIKELPTIKNDTATEADLLKLDETDITDILDELYKMNTDINETRKVMINDLSTILEKYPELQAVAQPPQVERKQKEPDKLPEKPKAKVQKAKFTPYTTAASFAEQYRESANEYFNKTKKFKIFPKYLLGYITNPVKKPKTMTDAELQTETQNRINKINASSVNKLWGYYRDNLKMADKKAYFT
jgi:hypothetical protein